MVTGMIAQIYTVWFIVLAVATVVVLLAATLLLVILSVARSILRHGTQALVAAEAIAADTKVIWALADTNRVAGDILDTAGRIEGNGGRIAALLHDTPAGLGGVRA